MKRSSPRFCVRRAGALLVWAAVALLAAGCQNIFVQKHRVLVDAITAPEAEKPAGKSYRLVAKRTMVSNTPVHIPILKACVDAALAGQGLYEPPANTPPELIIEVSCGRDASSRAIAAVRETYLQLSARSNPARAMEKATGPELWDVRVAVLGLSGSIETALPLLSTVAAEHMATNTGVETRIEVPQNAPSVEAVRLAALKTLESQAQRVAAASTAPAVAPSATRNTTANPAAGSAPTGSAEPAKVVPNSSEAAPGDLRERMQPLPPEPAPAPNNEATAGRSAPAATPN